MHFINKNNELLLASVIFLTILKTYYPFYKAIILMLEFISGKNGCGVYKKENRRKITLQ